MTGMHTPQSPLSIFKGENPNGIWTLNVSDHAGLNSGSVEFFSLQFVPAQDAANRAPRLIQSTEDASPVAKTAVACSPVTYSYTGPAVPIPDAADLSGTLPGAAVQASLTVAGFVGTIADVNLRINGSSCSSTIGSTTVGIDHTFVNDLKIRLRSPLGTLVEVIVNTDGSGNNFCQTVLDDQSGGPSIQTVVSANAPFTGTFTPANPLTAFNGQDPNGTWQLEAQDYFAADTGNIRAFSIILTANSTTTLTCPPNVSVNAAMASCAAVATYAPPTSTGGCFAVTIVCAPPSGSSFNVGVTTVTCTGTDGSGNSGSCSFTVTVNDTQNPTITCPPNITQDATPYANSKVVSWPSSTVSDNCPGLGSPTCVPASGSSFVVGTTTVTCSVTDASAHTSTCSFTVTLTPWCCRIRAMETAW